MYEDIKNKIVRTQIWTQYEHNILSFVLYNIHIDNKYEKDLICLIIKYKNI